jgi:hypothetical protein
MAFYQATGTGPVSFLDENEEQRELPLSAIYIGPSGADATTSSLYTTANQPLINALLAEMISAGYIAPGANQTSITATAVQAGPMGNSITITFSNPLPSAGTVDVTVTATETYAGLTPASILTTLGTTAAAASGLVYVTAGSNEMPAAAGPTFLPGPSFQLAVTDAADASTAFTLTATNTTDAADAALISVTVTPVTPPATPVAFNLTVSWTKSTTAPVTMATLLSTNPFAYLITLPSSVATGPLPVAGSVTLSGGAAASGSQPAVAATANILAAAP